MEQIQSAWIIFVHRLCGSLLDHLKIVHAVVCHGALH
jgi:hypothetical protein